MTRPAKKDRERRCVARWLQRRSIAAHPEDYEHPDFVVRHGAEVLGIEIVEYHGGGALGRSGSKGRQVESAWEALLAYSDRFRKRNSDVDPFEVMLHFTRYRMPPPSLFEDFCRAIARLIRQNKDLAQGQRLDIPITADIDPLLASYLIGVQIIRAEPRWVQWEWPALLSGHVGTSDEELHAVVAGKLRAYRPPPEITSSHLVIAGGSTLTRTAAPLSTFHLATYSRLNRALRGGPFDTVAILCLRDFIWSNAEGWKDFPAYK